MKPLVVTVLQSEVPKSEWCKNPNSPKLFLLISWPNVKGFQLKILDFNGIDEHFKRSHSGHESMHIWKESNLANVSHVVHETDGGTCFTLAAISRSNVDGLQALMADLKGLISTQNRPINTNTNWTSPLPTIAMWNTRWCTSRPNLDGFWPSIHHFGALYAPKNLPFIHVSLGGSLLSQEPSKAPKLGAQNSSGCLGRISFSLKQW